MTIDIQNIGPITKENIVEYFAAAKRWLRIASFVASFIPGTKDKAILAEVVSAINAVEPYAEQDGVVEIVNVVLQLLKSHTAGDAIAAIRDAVSKILPTK